MAYQPGSPPDPTDQQAVVNYLTAELLTIKNELDLIQQGRLTVLYNAPTKPREGQIVHADGTSWNPGAGAGPYSYTGGTWHKLF